MDQRTIQEVRFSLWPVGCQNTTSFGRLIAAAAVFTLLISTFMPPTSWFSNEEHYLMLSLRRFAPDAFSQQNVVAIDVSNARFLGEYFMGSFVSLFGYETSHAFLRVLMAVAYGLSFAFLFSVVSLSIPEGIIVLSLYKMLEKTTMGGEWLFRGVETKTWAYAAVVAALACAIRGSWILAAVFAALATYFHFLVGGFWCVVVIFVYFYMHKQIRESILIAITYAACVVPLVIVILFEQTSQSQAPLLSSDGKSADYIYSFVRLAHHVGPFQKGFWGTGWASGALATGAATLACLVLLRGARQRLSRALLLSVLTIGVFLLLAIVASYVDRHTGKLGKFYLFRPSAFALLLFIVAASLCLKERLVSPRSVSVVAVASTLLAGLLLATSVSDAIKKTERSAEEKRVLQQQLRPVLEYVNSRTDSLDVILVDPALDKLHSIPRLLNRPTLIGRKFMPSTPEAIIKWQNLMNFRKRVFRDGCIKAMEHRVDFLLINVADGVQRTLFSCGDIVAKNTNYALLRLK